MTKRMHIYEDNAGKWRWKLWSSSDVVADSGQGYASRGEAVKMARSFDDDAELEVDQPAFDEIRDA